MLYDKNKNNFVTNCCKLTAILRLLTITLIATACHVQALSIQRTHRDRAELTDGNGVGRNVNALQQDSAVLNINPRLEYNNEWRPVGRGDPLKKDPTYDYSPPALERVRYWRADNESKDDYSNSNANSNSKKYSKDFATNQNKKEILLLGMLSEGRNRGQQYLTDSANLQHKNTAIRRSYYAHHHQHQLPTDLMPPPMQTIAPPQPQQQQQQQTSSTAHHMMMMTSSSSSMPTNQYRQSTPHHSSTSTMAMMPSTSSSAHTSPAVMQPYRHPYTNSPPPQPPSPHHMMLPYEREYYHHDSMNYFKHTPGNMVSFTPSNMIDNRPNSFKHSSQIGANRKPWLHELLQKEVIKMPPKLLLNTYEQVGISTTQMPVAFRPMTSTNTVTSATSTPSTMTSPTAISLASTSPVFFTTAAPTLATSTAAYTPSTTSKRLLIPTTSNLLERPTITPMKMTTDALFKHYKQPDSPLLGPMYLIIEGHSKVKTYGKDELDPHQPKIVPIVPKREPIVRIADPNEKRGTKETFEVKHLHTVQTTTTAMPKTTSTTTTTPSPTKKSKPKKSSTPKTTAAPTTTASTISTTPTPSTRTTSTLAATNASESTIEGESPPLTSNAGMASLFSFLDSSLGSLFVEPAADSSLKNDEVNFVTTLSPPSTTKLHAIAGESSPLVKARIGTHSGSIDSLLDLEDEQFEKVTTEPLPRDVRQVFDYDQLPESRLKERMDVDVKDDEDVNGEDNDVDESMLAGVDLLSAAADDSDEDIDLEDIEKLALNEYDDDDDDDNEHKNEQKDEDTDDDDEDESQNKDDDDVESNKVSKLIEEIADDSNESVEIKET